VNPGALVIKAMLKTSQKVGVDRVVPTRTKWSLTWISLPADIISTVEFDHTGNYLATGDKGGRVVLFERNESVSKELIPSFQQACIPLSIRD